MMRWFFALTSNERFWINYGTALHFPNSSSAQWRIPIAVQIIPGGLLFISMFFVRYSNCIMRSVDSYGSTGMGEPSMARPARPV